jgi:hypothetical protein
MIDSRFRDGVELEMLQHWWLSTVSRSNATRKLNYCHKHQRVNHCQTEVYMMDSIYP